MWAELSRLNGAEMVAEFKDGQGAGSVAIAKRSLGSSTAWYQGTQLTEKSQREFFSSLAKTLGLSATGSESRELIRRGPYQIEIDHAANTVKVSKS